MPNRIRSRLRLRERFVSERTDKGIQFFPDVLNEFTGERMLIFFYVASSFRIDERKHPKK
mgnify:CR=1 FL=1